MKLHHKLILALILGAILGTFFHSYQDQEILSQISKNVFDPMGQVFLRLIFMIVVPMVFCGLVLGVFELGQEKDLGPVIRKTLFYTLLSSTASVIIGISLVQFFQPGKAFQIASVAGSINTAKVENIQQNANAAKPMMQSLVEIIPKNPLESAVKALDGEMLSLMFFALFFGIALSFIIRREDSLLIKVLDEIYQACLKVVGLVMGLAPYAVFALVFNSTFKFGFDLIVSLAAYVAIVLAALAFQQFGVYAILLKYFAKVSPWKFFKNCESVYVHAFATASSNATLPKSLEVAEKILKLPKASSRFVLTVGSTANQNGTALFEGITVLFLAQVYNIDLTLAQQVQVVLMSILAGVGTAGVPGGSLPLIMILLNQVGIPAEGIGLILGVDRFLDMCRTTVNVSGDLVIAQLVASGQEKSEKIS